MFNEPEYIDASPSAAFLMESIRDFGYTIETAIADLVDNSISAEASNIEINLDNDENGNPMISIEDDGVGMNKVELFFPDREKFAHSNCKSMLQKPSFVAIVAVH